MSLSTFVKVSNITNLSDARYCAGMMVDLLGFNLNSESTNFVNQQVFNDIVGWISGVTIVGEFGEASRDYIENTIQDFEVDCVETNNLENAIYLIGKGYNTALKLFISQNNFDDFDAILSEKLPLTYLIINHDNHSLEKEMIETIKKNQGLIKLIKGYGNTVDNIKFLSPAWSGIELVGSHEERPGFKDYGEVMDILELLEKD